MKTKDDILNQMDEVIQYFINHPDNQPNTDHCRNVDRLINLKADLANGDNTESEPSINYDSVLGTVDYEYEHLFISDEGEPCPIDGWMPIATSRIKHPERIQEYIERGRLRKIKPQ